jgi:NADPH-dependent 2,4-dienoyl-CoA reductase/sulfur reductase-like enzyme
MPYYIGDVIQDKKTLIARTPEQFAEHGVTVKLRSRVEEIDTDRGCVRLSNGEALPYDTLVMGTGSEAFMPDIPGTDLEGVFKLKNLTDAFRMKAYIQEKGCRKAIILGAGFIAMEMSEALTNLGIETHVVYRGEQPVRQWDPAFSHIILQELRDNNVVFVNNTVPVAIERGAGASGLHLMTDNGGMEADIIVCAFGVRPNTALGREAGLQIGSTGAIKVNFSQQTSLEEIYAVGDCCEAFHRVSKEWVFLPLGDIANRQGRVAGCNIGRFPRSFPGIVGSQSFKVFNLEIAKTGLDEKAALKSGYHPVNTVIEGTSIARSLSTDETLHLKLVADRQSGKLLGAQAVGQKGAVGRINTLSACLWSEMDLDEIGYMDLAYSPYFGGGWDAIQIAAQVLKKSM